MPVGKRLPHLYSAAYMIMRQHQSVLLSRRCNTGFKDGWYTLPAGHCRPRELIKNCVIREAAEELGVNLQPHNITVLSVIHRPNKRREYMDFFCEVRAWDGEICNLEPDKCDDLQFFPADSLPEKTIDYVKVGLENALSGVPFAEAGWEGQDSI